MLRLGHTKTRKDTKRLEKTRKDTRKDTKRHTKRHNTMRIDTNKSRSNALLVSFRVFSRFSILKCEKTRKDGKRQAKTPQET